MSINVPATQVEDFTSRMDGSRYSSFTPDTQLSSPMTGTVRFDYDVSRNCYLYIRVLNMDGEEVRISLTGWTRYTSNPLRYRVTVRSSGSSTTVDIPEGYQLVAVHLGSTANTDATINHFSVTGFSEGLVERVWYNEWIAEVYQGRDLIYTAYNVVDTGFVWNPSHGAQYRVPELSEPLDIRVETTGSTTVRLDHVGRWEVSGTGTISLTPEMSGRVLTFIAGSPSVHGLEEALELYLISLTRGGLVNHGTAELPRPSPPYDTYPAHSYDNLGFYVSEARGVNEYSMVKAHNLGSETVSLRVGFGRTRKSRSGFLPSSVSVAAGKMIFEFGSESTTFSLTIGYGSTVRVGGVSASTPELTDFENSARDTFSDYTFELGLNRWLTHPDAVLVSFAVIDPQGSLVGVYNLTDHAQDSDLDELRLMMSEGNWWAGFRLYHPQATTGYGTTIKTSHLQFSLPRHEYES